IDLRRITRPGPQGGEVQYQLDALRLGAPADQEGRAPDALVQVHFLAAALVRAGKVAQIEDDPLDPPQALAGAGDQALEVLQEVGQVGLVGGRVDAPEQGGVVLGDERVGLPVEAEQVDQVAEVAPQDGDVVEDEGQG